MWFQSLEEITFDIADPLNYLNCKKDDVLVGKKKWQKGYWCNVLLMKIKTPSKLK
jgi:hypothetical protein